MTQPGIEPATLRFVAQHLNHCATAAPFWNRSNHKCIHDLQCSEARKVKRINGQYNTPRSALNGSYDFKANDIN